MCGFVGIIDRSGLPFDVSLLRYARDLLRHRGPDSAGEYVDSNAYLGFRRLAILDLSPLGDQPMKSEDGLVWIVFNGEIYNYVELRSELEKVGHRFKSSSDTEVLLHLYDEYDVDMFERLCGMFAIAIYDRRKGQVVLARDRMGQKPLFYWLSPGRVAFASELRALRVFPDFPMDLDGRAVGLYLRMGWVPGWTSVHRGIDKLPPASWLSIDIRTGHAQGPVSYWSLPDVAIEVGVEENEWIDRIEALLWDATRIRLRSDVPLGVFLSGGIDSGLISAAANSQVNGDLTSLSINFPGWSSSEWPLALETANHLEIEPICEDLDIDGAHLLPAVFGQFDEPFADSSALPTSLLYQAAQKHVTVALSGDGGDEIFGGYRTHLRAWQLRHLDKVPLSIRRTVAQSIGNLLPPDSRERRFLRRSSYPVGTLGVGSMLYPFPDWANNLVRPEFRLAEDEVESLFEKHVIRWPGASALEQAQRTDMRMVMLDDILVKVDRMSMLHSLEVRSPFLDHRIVEMALAIPPSLRTRNNQNKYMLRRLAARVLPEAVVQAPKRGFEIPVQHWIFQSRHRDSFKELACSPPKGAPDPLVAGGGQKLWDMAEKNGTLVAALFRVFAYRWWVQSLG